MLVAVWFELRYTEAPLALTSSGGLTKGVVLKTAQSYRGSFSAVVLLCVCSVALLMTTRAHAQVDATKWRSGLVTLDQGWRVQGGDDRAWAQPGFDDRGWKQVDLVDLGVAPNGWQWYRLHVKLPSNHDHVHLLIAGGSGTYELYINGKRAEGARIGSVLHVSRPTEQVFNVPDQESDLEIAIRMWATPMYIGWHLPAFLTLALGTPDLIENERAALQSERLYQTIPSITINLAVVLAGIGAFALFWSQRGHRDYMWLALYLLLLGISNGLLYTSTSGVLPLAWNNSLADPLIYVIMIMQIEFTFSFAGRKPGKIWRAYEILLLVSMTANPFSILLNWIPANIYLLFESILISPIAVFLPILLAIWYRKGNKEAGWLILPSLMPAGAVAMFNIGSASLFTGFGKLDFLANPIPLGPALLQLSDLGDLLFVLSIGVVMFFRFTRVSREQTRTAAELEAAREMQQRLVPAQLPEVRGYAVEAAYFPAQEVGGDFYQIFDQAGGAKIVVVGDVSGKGLKAAMTGTLALGAMRALAAEGFGPAELLNRLNCQIAEMGQGGFVTCICVRMDEPGWITIANAGHLPPYCDGKELEVSSDLPLGISPAQQYEERVFRLHPGDRLTLLSDGVLEARDAHGALLGFERTRAISGQSAAAIADEARRFGQEDDITVLSLVLVPAEVVHA